ncbi:MAG: hypothetical protein LH631_01190 [Alkalinema sp. CAN_BIN05]|nr:hypothetical protein [Alkalinema sp. CAN_BIN05]
MLQTTLPKWMIPIATIVSIGAGFGFSFGFVQSAQALPGQGSDEVLLWMKANPGIRPSPTEKLTIHRSNGPSQRMTFEASVLSPGRITASRTGGRIRAETLTLFDMLYGVSEARLEATVRSIYGLEVHRDFQTAKVIYAYPTIKEEATAIQANQPIAAALKGELRQGSRFAYWTEILRNRDGLNYGGKVVVFLTEDLSKIEGEIKSR